MLKGLHRLLSPDLLYALAAMGHGDELALVDRNYPAVSNGHRVVQLTGADAPSALEAIVSIFPIDTFVTPAVLRMEVVGESATIPAVQRELIACCEAGEGRPLEVGSLSREEFYARAASAFVHVVTSEARPYACLLVKKGVIND